MPYAERILSLSAQALTETGRALTGRCGVGLLEDLAASLGQPPYRGRQVFEWIHRRGVLDPLAMTNLPLDLRTRLTTTRGEEARRLS